MSATGPALVDVAALHRRADAADAQARDWALNGDLALATLRRRDADWLRAKAQESLKAMADAERAGAAT